MNENISYQFSKHYKRIIEDLRQVQGFTPAMEKLLSFNITKLENDIKNELTNERTRMD